MMSQIRISAIKGTTFPEGAGIRPCRPALAVCSAPPQGDPPGWGSLQDVLSYKEKGFYRLPCLILFPHFYTGTNIFLPGVIRNILSTVCTPHKPQSIPYSYGYIL